MKRFIAIVLFGVVAMFVSVIFTGWVATGFFLFWYLLGSVWLYFAK